MRHKLLSSPIAIGPAQSRNRIVLPAMELNYSMDGRVNDKHLAFYAERARGGAGLIVVGGCTIDKWAGARHMLSLKDDEAIEGMARLAEAVHEGGALIGAQLYAAGAYAHSFLTGEQAISASEHTSKFTKELCREMTVEEISRSIDNFVAAARRAEQGGLDLIEVSGSAGYLICQFLSPKTNKREDAYGGSLDNRMRFGIEVCQAIRAALKPETALAIRVAGNDYVPDSHTNAEACQFAAAVAPHVDMINVTGGWHETRVPQLPADVPRAAFVYLARAIRAAVDKPVAASNRLGDPDLAEQVLTSGAADLVCMARPLIADPALPNKVLRGEADTITPCTACNQGCFDPIFKLQPVGCMVNPRAGRESEIEVTPAAAARRVVVVGGGVAGATAAIVAAERGHSVTLCERERHLGGQVAWAAVPTHKPEFPGFLDHQRRQMERLGVDLRLGQAADAETIRNLEPEVVIVATGAKPKTAPIPGADQDHVKDAWQVLQDRSLVGERVVVIGGGSVGCETALWLAAEGTLSPEQLDFLLFYDAETEEVLKQLQRKGFRQVTVVEMAPKLCTDLGSRRWIVIDALHKRGVRTLKGVEVQTIEKNGVRIRTAGGDEELLECDTVVLAVGAEPVAELPDQLTELSGVEVHSVGDCQKVGRIPDAIAGAFDVARSI